MGLAGGNRLMEHKECAVCGQPFEPRCGVQKYCSEECAARAQAEKVRERRRRRRELHLGPWAERECKTCGRAFYPGHHRQAYCSDGCRRKAESRQAAKSCERARTVPLLVEGPMTGRVFVVTRYARIDGGGIQAKEKFDVTDQFEAIAERRAAR